MSLCWSDTRLVSGQLLQHLKRIISDLCKLYNLPQHPDVEMLDQPLPAEQVSAAGGGSQAPQTGSLQPEPEAEASSPPEEPCSRTLLLSPRGGSNPGRCQWLPWPGAVSLLWLFAARLLGFALPFAWLCWGIPCALCLWRAWDRGGVAPGR